MIRSNYSLYPILFLFYLFFQSCSTESPTNELVIAIVWPEKKKDFFHEGVELAIKHLKQESSIIKDKNIRFVNIDEGWYESLEADYRGTQNLVNNIVNIPGIFAVIGHASNRLSEFSSLSYDKHGITFINIGATATFTSSHGFDYYYRAFPNDQEIAKKIVLSLINNGYTKPIIIWEPIESKNISLEIIHEYAKNRINIVRDFNFYPVDHKRDYSKRDHKLDKTFMKISATISKMDKDTYDSIIILGHSPPTAYLVNALRKVGVSKLIAGNHRFDSKGFLKLIDQTERKINLPETSFDSLESSKETHLDFSRLDQATQISLAQSYKSEFESLSPLVFPTFINKTWLPIANRLFQPEPEDYPIFDKFVEEFYDEYSDYPDTWATAGYKSIKLLINGIMEINSVTPDAVNGYLEFHNKSMGVTGPNRYNSKGELESPEIYFNTYFNGNLKRLIIPEGEMEIVKLGLETG